MSPVFSETPGNCPLGSLTGFETLTVYADFVGVFFLPFIFIPQPAKFGESAFLTYRKLHKIARVSRTLMCGGLWRK